MSPSGASAIAIGPMMPSLWAKPVANDWAWNGCKTVWNSDGSLDGGAAGTSCSACVNSGLVEGWTTGAGGMPKLGGVVLGTVGVAPRFTVVVSCGDVGQGGRLLVVAGHVGRQYQKRVGVAGLALVDHRAGRLGDLVLPDLVVAAVLGDVERHVRDARAARVVGGAPGHLVVALLPSWVAVVWVVGATVS